VGPAFQPVDDRLESLSHMTGGDTGRYRVKVGLSTGPLESEGE